MNTKIKLGAMVLFSAFLVASCDKDEEKSSPAPEGMATYKGKMFVNSNLPNDTTAFGAHQTQRETVPTGTKVTLSIDAIDLLDNPDFSYDYGIRTFSALTDANGDFTISVPAKNATTYDVVLDDFKIDVLTGYQGTILPVFNEEQLFSFGPTSVTLTVGQTKIQDFYY